MNVYCIVMFEFNYSVGDIKNSDLGEGIVCLGEESGGKGGREVGERGREVGIRGREVGSAYPPVHPSTLIRPLSGSSKSGLDSGFLLYVFQMRQSLVNNQSYLGYGYRGVFIDSKQILILGLMPWFGSMSQNLRHLCKRVHFCYSNRSDSRMTLTLVSLIESQCELYSKVK